MEDCSIREGLRTDRPGLRRLWQAARQATYAPLVGDAGVDAMLRALDASDLRDMLPGQDECLLVAVHHGQVVGSAVYAERRGTAYLWGMYVHPGHQRRGIGTALLALVAARLSQTATVEVRMLRSSAWAEAFYRRCGFVEAGPCPVRLTADQADRPGVVMTASSATLRHLGRGTLSDAGRAC